MSRLLRHHWPLLIAIAVYWVIVGGLLLISTSQNEGELAYALDDPYIHMAMARNFSQSGVWGVTSYEFSSSSSSPLWTLLLASVYKVIGPNVWSPLLLNLIFGTAVLTAGSIFLTQYGIRRWWALVILLLLVFVTPLPALTFVGMEHLLHVLLALIFVVLAAQALASPESGRKSYVGLFVLAPLATSVRLESLFMVAAVALLLVVLRRRWLDAFLLLALGALPVVVYGLIALAHGWHFLPNSILLKSNIPEMDSLSGILYALGYRGLKTLYWTPLLLFLVLGALRLLALHWQSRPVQRSSAIALMSAIFVPMVLLHVQFARLGWFYRYEAYLVALGIMIIALGLGVLPHPKLSWRRPNTSSAWLGYARAAVMLALLSMPFVMRATSSLVITPMATNDIYQQQVQMGLFLRRYYGSETIVVNDIGAIGFLSTSDILDLWGLGTLETADLKMRGGTPEATAELAQRRHARVAMIYDHSSTPERWVKVGEWTLSHPQLVEPTVSIFAVDPAEAPALIANLREFAGELPRAVIQSGPYTE